MSFLNPVNEPVLRFKSTDASAPQINYNARTAGDVKAVLKACLVTGYGATASAGWSIVNEVDHVAEFVSPSAAMSDYRLGIDGTSTSSTTWYYQYQGVRKNPTGSTASKNFTNFNKASPKNGWQLLVTDQGLCFIEILYRDDIAATVARLIQWGRIKSALTSNTGGNIAFWSIGANGQSSYPYDSTAPNNITLGQYTSTTLESVNLSLFKASTQAYGVYATDIAAEIYLRSDSVFLGKYPALILGTVSKQQDVFGVNDTALDGRPALKLCLGVDVGNFASFERGSRVMYVYLDYWEY